MGCTGCGTGCGSDLLVRFFGRDDGEKVAKFGTGLGGAVIIYRFAVLDEIPVLATLI